VEKYSLLSSNLYYFETSEHILAKHGLQALPIRVNGRSKVGACGITASWIFHSLKIANSDKKK